MSKPDEIPEEAPRLPSVIEYEKRLEGVKSLEMKVERGKSNEGRHKITITIRGDPEAIETLEVHPFVQMGDCVILVASNYNLGKTQWSFKGRVKPIEAPKGQKTLFDT